MLGSTVGQEKSKAPISDQGDDGVTHEVVLEAAREEGLVEQALPEWTDSLASFGTSASIVREERIGVTPSLEVVIYHFSDLTISVELWTKGRWRLDDLANRDDDAIRRAAAARFVLRKLKEALPVLRRIAEQG